MGLYWYQQEAIDSIFHYFTAKAGNPVVALPTGTGKSHVIAGFLQRALGYWPTTRVMMLTHVKELIEQNANKLVGAWPHAPLGIYSAGLKSRDIMHPIIFGGVQSVVNNIGVFGHRDLLLIDEAHLLSLKDDTRYLETIIGLRQTNPLLKVVGLTATPYRLGQGMITDGVLVKDDEGRDIERKLFTDICYDMTTLEAFNRLITEGYLCPLIARPTVTKLDLSQVKITAGDFNEAQAQRAINKEEITRDAVREMCAQAYDRRSWLIFCCGVEHADDVAEMLRANGISAASVHSKMDATERDARIAAYKRGEIRALTNNNVLTTGFDDPKTDFIGMIRPTMSPGLWVQMLGRGTRICVGKRNCLVLDFAGNTERLGPINDVLKPRKKGAGAGEAPVKICTACGVYNHASVRFCAACGAPFEFRVKFGATASNLDVIKYDGPIVEEFDVLNVSYAKHEKAGKPPSLKVTYFCSGYQAFSEWVPIEAGKGRGLASKWWRQRSPHDLPIDVDTALTITSTLRAPKKIFVWVNQRYPEITRHVW